MKTHCRPACCQLVAAVAIIVYFAAPESQGDEVSPNALAAELKKLDARVFSANEQAQAARQLPDDLGRRLRAANERSTSEWRQITSRDEWAAFRAAKLAALQVSLGEFSPPPKSMATHVTATIDGDGFVIEKLLFESRPGVWVSANLYRPARADAPPASQPGIVICHSHHTPKTHGELQDMGMTWARLGCVVLVPDHIGHGERRQHPFAADRDFEKPFRASRQDYYFRYDVGLQLDVAGQSLVGQIAWDLMRGVDVLLARPGVNPQRIVLLGAVAGGGDPAAVAAALDDRIAAAVPFNFGGPQPETRFPLPDDSETSFNYAGSGGWESTRNLRRSAADGFLPWVIVGGIAPRRLVYGHEFRWDREHDPVWRRLETNYGWHDAADRLAFAHGRGELKGQPPDASHCTHIGSIHRQLIHEAFQRWFDIPDGADREYSQRRPSDELLCWTAALREQLKPQSLRERLAAEADERLAKLREELAARSLDERRQLLRQRWAKILGNVEPAAEPKVNSTRDELLAAPPADVTKIRVTRVQLEVEPEITVPLLLLVPQRVEKKSAPLVVAVSQAGKAAFLKERSDEIAALLAGGIAVCLPDVRGTGEMNADDGRDRTSAATSYSSSEQMLGGTLVGARLRDLRSVLRHLHGRDDVDARRVALWGDSFGPVNPPDTQLEVPHGIDNRPRECEPLGGLLALFAALYEPDVRAVYIHGGLDGFRSVFAGPCVYLPHDVVVPGALSSGDLCDVAAVLTPRPLRLDSLVNSSNQRLSRPAENDSYAPTLAAYRSQSAETKLYFGDAGIAPWLVNILQRE